MWQDIFPIHRKNDARSSAARKQFSDDLLRAQIKESYRKLAEKKE